MMLKVVLMHVNLMFTVLIIHILISIIQSTRNVLNVKLRCNIVQHVMLKIFVRNAQVQNYNCNIIHNIKFLKGIRPYLKEDSTGCVAECTDVEGHYNDNLNL